MNKIYSLFVILSAKEQQPYILSTNQQEIILPYQQLITPAKLKQETRYILRNFFSEATFQFPEECSYNFLDIQEENSIDYIASINNAYGIDDLCLTCGGVSDFFDLKPNLFWNKLIFNYDYNGYTTNKPLNLLIDNVINKTTYS